MFRKCLRIIITPLLLASLFSSALFAEEKQSTSLEEIFQKIHHVAIIPDGNRRWAKLNDLTVAEGHRYAFLVVFPKLAEKLFDEGLNTLTIWMFSTENWKRSADEVADLMNLYEEGIELLLSMAHRQEIKITHLGRKDRIPKSLLAIVEKAQLQTRDYKKHYLNLALDYGGKDEIERAMKDLLKDPSGSWQNLDSYLDTKDLPYPNPDLVIRTSGEQRLSGFMIWQTAYSEFYFEPNHFPTLTSERIQRILEDFANRQRRFGK